MNEPVEKSDTSDESGHSAWLSGPPGAAEATRAGFVDARRLEAAVAHIDARLAACGASAPVLSELGADPEPVNRMALARSTPPALLTRGDDATRRTLDSGTVPAQLELTADVADFLAPLASQWVSGFCAGLDACNGDHVAEADLRRAVRRLDTAASSILQDTCDYESARDIAARRSTAILPSLPRPADKPSAQRDEAAALAATWLDGLATALTARLSSRHRTPRAGER